MCACPSPPPLRALPATPERQFTRLSVAESKAQVNASLSGEKRHKSRVISIYHRKGGAGKTTSAFTLATALATMGRRVLLVDGDTQCNLTAFAYGDDIEEAGGLSAWLNRLQAEYYADAPERAGLMATLAAMRPVPRKPQQSAPASMPDIAGLPGSLSVAALFAVEVVVPPGTPGRVLLVPGNEDLHDWDEVLFEFHRALGPSSPALPNSYPYGAPRAAITATAALYDADFVIIDLSPHNGPLNRNLFMTSDYFILAGTVDTASRDGIANLANCIVRQCPPDGSAHWMAGWHQRHMEALGLVLEPALPRHPPKFLGAIISRFSTTKGRNRIGPTGLITNQAKANGMEAILASCLHAAEELTVELRRCGMALREATLAACRRQAIIGLIQELGQVSIQCQHFHHTPLPYLRDEQLGTLKYNERTHKTTKQSVGGCCFKGQVRTRDTVRLCWDTVAHTVMALIGEEERPPAEEATGAAGAADAPVVPAALLPAALVAQPLDGSAAVAALPAMGADIQEMAEQIARMEAADEADEAEDVVVPTAARAARRQAGSDELPPTRRQRRED